MMKMTLNEEIEYLQSGNWYDKIRAVLPTDEYLKLGWAIGDILETLELFRSLAPEPQTNADRIRAMSDEELAEFLILSPEMEFDVCRFCEYGNTSGDDRGICLTKDGICRAEANCAAFKKWLRQPAEEDT